MAAGEEGHYITADTVTTRMTPTYFKMGSAESHFHISLIVRDIVTRQCPLRPQLLKRKERQNGFEPKSVSVLTHQPDTLPLG